MINLKSAVTLNPVSNSKSKTDSGPRDKKSAADDVRSGRLCGAKQHENIRLDLYLNKIAC